MDKKYTIDVSPADPTIHFIVYDGVDCTESSRVNSNNDDCVHVPSAPNCVPMNIVGASAVGNHSAYPCGAADIGQSPELNVIVWFCTECNTPLNEFAYILLLEGLVVISPNATS